MSLARLAFGLSFLLSTPALAESPDHGAGHGHPMGNGGTCGTPAPHAANEAGFRHIGTPSKVIFLDRCVGGCVFTGDTAHDAINSRVAIRGTEVGATYAFEEFSSFSGQRGAAADAEWNQIVDCARKIYAYYDTVVTDVKPTTGTYHRAVLSGIGTQLIAGSDPTLLGISDVDCAGAIHNMTSFTFADAHKRFTGSAAGYVKDVCNTVTHEAGHSFGLEHEFEYLDGTSACSDPMSYDTGACNPQFHFFRNKPARCGGFELTPCACSTTVNSHVTLSGVFGTATPEMADATAQIVSPTADQQVGSMIVASAGHPRGIERVELYINGFKWAQLPGLEWTRGGGQPTPGQYAFPVPARLPDSVLDIQIKIYDDLGNAAESEVMTAVKGAACVDESTCAEGQHCGNGRCFWDPAAGEIGDACTYPEFCVSGQCSTSTFQGDGVCTTSCVVGLADACPNGLECIDTGNGGVCYTPAEGGCCSASTSTPWGPFMLGAVAIAQLLRRRRRTTA